MLRRIALTLVPSVAIYTVAACLATPLAPRNASKASLSTPAPIMTTALKLAARSGYIVASS
jgi:hypothetical protein